MLVDPNRLAEGSVIDWYHPSPDGEHVAYGISRHGDEQSVLHVIASRSGEILPVRVPHTSFSRVAWLPDGGGFYYSGGIAPDHVDAEKRLFFYSLADTAGTPREAEPLHLGDPYVSPYVSPDGRYVVVNVSWEKPRAAYYLDRHAHDGWRPFLRDLDGESFGTFVGNTFYALTTHDAPRGRIIAIPMATAEDPATWVEVVPEGETVLRHFVPVGDQLLISELHEASSRLRLVTPAAGLAQDGGEVSNPGTPAGHSEGPPPERVIELPGPGLIQGTGALDSSPFSVDGNAVCFGFETFTRPATTYRLDLATGGLEAQDAAAELSQLTVRLEWCESEDGTRVPYYVVHRADLDRSRPQPTLIYGYGGWNLINGPEFVGLGGSGVLPFLEAGGVYVSAVLRGGGEFGRDWWQAGRRRQKQNTFDDLYAVAEHLIGRGATTPARLAVWGRSNGGLLTAVALTQRPELFGAVVSEVPLTDMLRALDHPYLASYRVEYGSPHDAEMFPVLRAYSPVHNVTPGTRYPATLILCAESDLRCQPWNARKLAAHLQAATASPAPVLLRTAPGGHGGALETDHLVARCTDVLTFVMQQLGMRLPAAAIP